MKSHRDSLSNTEEKSKDILFNWNAKNKIHIQAEHLLSVTITKTSIELIQRLSTIFTDAYKKDLPIKDDDEDKSILSVHNMTGYEILIDDITNVEVELYVITIKMILLLLSLPRIINQRLRSVSNMKNPFQ
jgi:hypothetical protein